MGRGMGGEPGWLHDDGDATPIPVLAARARRWPICDRGGGQMQCAEGGGSGGDGSHDGGDSTRGGGRGGSGRAPRPPACRSAEGMKRSHLRLPLDAYQQPELTGVPTCPLRAPCPVLCRRHRRCSTGGGQVVVHTRLASPPTGGTTRVSLRAAAWGGALERGHHLVVQLTTGSQVAAPAGGVRPTRGGRNIKTPGSVLHGTSEGGGGGRR